MRKINLLTAEQVIQVNRVVCEDGANRHQCYSIDKVASALHSAFYPGAYPFQHGGVAEIAGALAFYLMMAYAPFDANKRTAAVSSLMFMKFNGLTLSFPKNPDALADLILECARGSTAKEYLMQWHETYNIII